MDMPEEAAHRRTKGMDDPEGRVGRGWSCRAFRRMTIVAQHQKYRSLMTMGIARLHRGADRHRNGDDLAADDAGQLGIGSVRARRVAACDGDPVGTPSSRSTKGIGPRSTSPSTKNGRYCSTSTETRGSRRKPPRSLPSIERASPCVVCPCASMVPISGMEMRPAPSTGIAVWKRILPENDDAQPVSARERIGFVNVSVEKFPASGVARLRIRKAQVSRQRRKCPASRHGGMGLREVLQEALTNIERVWLMIGQFRALLNPKKSMFACRIGPFEDRSPGMDVGVPIRPAPLLCGDASERWRAASALWRRKFWILIPTNSCVFRLLRRREPALRPLFRRGAPASRESRDRSIRALIAIPAPPIRRSTPRLLPARCRSTMSKDLAFKVIRDMGLAKKAEFDPIANGVNPIKALLVSFGLVPRSAPDAARGARCRNLFQALAGFPAGQEPGDSSSFNLEDPALAAAIADRDRRGISQARRGCQERDKRSDFGMARQGHRTIR